MHYFFSMAIDPLVVYDLVNLLYGNRHTKIM
jgi:hypothetical protein